jgi:hypothetical protein
VTDQKQYPEWQNALREAVNKQAAIEDERMRQKAEAEAKQRAEDEKKMSRVLSFFGIEGAVILGTSATIDHYEFRFTESSGYGLHQNGRMSVTRTDATPYDPDLDVNPPFNYVLFPARNAYRKDDQDDPTEYRAELASMIDQTDEDLPTYEERIKNARSKPALKPKADPVAVQPTDAEILLDALKQFISNVLSRDYENL